MGWTGPRRDELSDNPIAISHQNRFAPGGQSHIFAEFVLEGLNPNGAHAIEVATLGYSVKQSS